VLTPAFIPFKRALSVSSSIEERFYNVTYVRIDWHQALGGLDGFLAKAKTDELSDKAAKIKRNIEKKLAEAA